MICTPKYLLFFAVLTIAVAATVQASEVNDKYKIHKNVVFAKADSHELALDLYLPEAKNPLLVVWVHGGAWHSGTRDSPPLFSAESGIAIASVDYRLSTQATFPAAIHDIKAAVRFLRANGKKYGYQTKNIAIWGSSAGGHLAALVGVTNGNKALEGSLGEYRETSSDIQAIVDHFGPTNFVTILDQSTPHGLSVRAPALALFLGAPVQQARNKAILASPVHHVDAGDPPILIVHGINDIQVPINQSHELAQEYFSRNLDAKLLVIPNAGHSSPVYFKPQELNKVEEFLKQHLK